MLTANSQSKEKEISIIIIKRPQPRPRSTGSSAERELYAAIDESTRLVTILFYSEAGDAEITIASETESYSSSYYASEYSCLHLQVPEGNGPYSLTISTDLYTAYGEILF